MTATRWCAWPLRVIVAAARELAALRSNVRRLRITDLAMRYVDENAGRSASGGATLLGDRAWVGDVQLDWRLGGFDEELSRMEVTMTFAETEDGAAFVTARSDYGEPAPLWLLERLAVERSQRSLVMATRDVEAERFAALADEAVADVRQVLPRWRGRLVVEVPESQAQLTRALGSGESSYDSIAAVTTPVDGSPAADTPIHIFVNPPVFEPLGEQGAQIVMSHEAAHVATEAASSSMPTWLLGGLRRLRRARARRPAGHGDRQPDPRPGPRGRCPGRASRLDGSSRRRTPRWVRRTSRPGWRAG